MAWYKTPTISYFGKDDIDKCQDAIIWCRNNLPILSWHVSYRNGGSGIHAVIQFNNEETLSFFLLLWNDRLNYL
jgi:hypothetical protein